MTVRVDAVTPRSIFEAAIVLPDGQARQTFVDLACRDNATLKARVCELLAAWERNQSSPIDAFVQIDLGATALNEEDVEKQHVSPDRPASAHSIRQVLQSQIGPYKLLEQIGQGGMGAVYMAQQTTPIKRKVALKLIKPGMDSREVIARFEAERQALAMMDHANIAHVLDAGTTEQGRPYFVMELVRGVPITDYCREKKVGLEKRLQLFIDVCRAVQHAHQKGIIHRDLKPSNILVTLHDGVPVVKVIDFGVAKALNQELTERTLFTNFSQMIGTPLYMAPEQAEMSGLDMDTRSDIYSLGVVLYELLTGTTPFEKEMMSKLGFDGFRKLLKEQEPPRPSLRLSTLKAANQSTLGDKRLLSMEEPSRRLQRELDWIVMKALEKDRARRYETATAFAADIERYLNKEAVLACPPTLSYRLAKFVGKHKAKITTAAVLVVMLFASTIVSAIFAFRAHNALVASDFSEQQARDAEAEAKTQTGLAIAEANRAAAAAANVLIAKNREESERRRAESALYVSDTRLAASEIRESAYRKGYESLIKHYSIDPQQRATSWEWYYLLDQADQSLVSWQAGATNIQGTNVQDIDWNPHRQQIAAVHWDSPSVRIWNSETGDLIRSFELGGLLTVGVSWSPNGDQLAWGSTVNDDKVTTTLRIWNSATDKVIELTADCFSHRSVEWSPDGTRIAVAAISEQGGPPKLLIYAEENGSWQLALNIPAGKSYYDNPDYDNLAWNHDGTRLFIGTSTKSVIADPVTLEPVFEFPMNGIRSGAWLKDDKMVATIAGRECVVFDIEKQEESRRFNVGPVSAVQVSENGELLATAGPDGFVKVWKVSDWSLVSLYEAHDGPVSSLTWSPDSTKVASSGNDGIISIWPAVKQVRDALIRRIDSRSGFVWTDSGAIQTIEKNRGLVEFHPDSSDLIRESVLEGSDKAWLLGSNLVARPASEDGDIEVLAVKGARSTPGQPAIKLHSVNRTYGKPDGTALVYVPETGRGFGQPVLVDSVSAKQLPLGTLAMGPQGFCWSPDGSTIAAIGYGREGDDGTPMWAGWVHTFDLNSGEAIHRARVGQNRIGASAGDWSPDSAKIACASGDGICEVFEAKTLRKLLSRRIHRQAVRGMSWHPTENRIASCGDDGTVAIWDATSGEVLIRFEIRTAVAQVEWSPSGKLLAARTDDGEFHTWSAAAGYDLAESSLFQKQYFGRLEAELVSKLVAEDFENAPHFARKLLREKKDIGFFPYYTLALLSINNGEILEYAQLCDEMIKQNQKSIVVDDLYFTAWTCALAPDAVDDYATVIEMARKSVLQESGSPQFQNGLGAILMRAGEYEEAHQVLSRALDATATQNSSPSYLHYFLTMTEHHLGHGEEAKKHLRKANELAAQESAVMTTWNRKLTLELLRKEAEAIIGSAAEINEP